MSLESGRGDRCRRGDLGAPTISRFHGIAIAMFFHDHGPPHFHARHADGSAKRADRHAGGHRQRTRTPAAAIRAGVGELHQEELLENWRLARAGETLKEIEPLR